MRSLIQFGRTSKATHAHAAFGRLMQSAKDISERQPDALFDLIAALLRPLQSEHLIAVAECEQHMAPGSIQGASFFFDITRFISVSKCWIQPTPPLTVRLASDPVLPTAWERGRFVSAITNIGGGRPHGAWTQDPNHQVSVWLPWNIAFVGGGNHSITAGILRGEGIITATEVIDASPIFDLVECDGRTFRLKDTGKVIATTEDHRRAAVFEIGRLISSSGVRKFQRHFDSLAQNEIL
jgi:hypothetical protein